VRRGSCCGGAEHDHLRADWGAIVKVGDELGRGIKGAATAQITRRDRAGNVKVPAASRRVDSRGRLAVTCPPREDQRDHNVSACL
jgi:hypothetical protein